MSAAPDRRLYRLAAQIAIVRDAAGRRVLWDTRSGGETAIGEAVAAVVDHFAVPRSVDAAAAALSARFGESGRDVVVGIVQELAAAGVIEPYAPEGMRVADGRGGMFNAPVLRPAEAFADESLRVVFLGAPYDFGVTNRAGGRTAPSWLRRHGAALYQYPRTADAPPGVWDPVDGRRRLAGVRMADLGDLVATVHHRNGEIFDQLQGVVERLARAGKLPVVMGGDHSLSLAVARGVAAAHDRIGIVQLDAHNDFGNPDPGDWRSGCHHGNFVDWLVADPRVERIVQIGVRQMTALDPPLHDKVTVLPGRVAERMSPEAWLATMPDDLVWHLTIDVDALDPSVLRSTGTMLPGGLSRDGAAEIVERLCASRRIAAIDLMELLPEAGSEADVLLASDLLLRAIDASTAPRE